MANIFDGLSDTAFDVTLATFGYDASWVPSAEPEATPLTARVHFKDPSQTEELRGVDFAPLSPFIEYRKPSFPGLYEAIREQNGGEVITVNGNAYNARHIEATHDGRVFKVYLEPLQ
jgi:hypothetical protein